MAEPVIEAEGLGIRFSAHRKRRRSLREVLLGARRGPAAAGGSFWPVRGASFSVHRGECVGIVGKNGTGKSTLLKMIAGVLIPDEGRVEVRGRVAPLLELRAGFNGQLTGRENIRLVGSLHGMSQEALDERFDEIVDFADLRGGYIDMPVRHYSSGMKVRLGFALVAQLEHPIMLVDEVLAVGDQEFRQKCYAAIERMLADGRTMVLVSHSDADLRHFCGRGLYLKDGAVALDSGIDTVLDAYQQDLTAEEGGPAPSGEAREEPAGERAAPGAPSRRGGAEAAAGTDAGRKDPGARRRIRGRDGGGGGAA
ncbi:ABC transporter ATP-binding protein [Streptomonospora litoralis]|uniref:Teichoic acids export ATP-binding protein TagH n=1 Tax=Streptomonospora litoralis TaxID=2498135 RepID=A0A4P6PWI7_9ACTN|nr:ABC transporter ATP-binding protein [Streptomonospora litoralis]QBI52465.1 Teichoic acids export ATP-binding protein TagH [Streptomonospora litoralis]